MRKNLRRPWTPEEDQERREMATTGKGVTVMALRLKRTEVSIRSRLSMLGISVKTAKKK